ncbi:coiled-coil-helix-coiled-coil-helix domain-containing protein 7 [Athalia rosae]|uniref:coiled-coil-helix-coiled-coil-helix domain-containing protein 7 n=1 Tax=Athalia rosae TaxID=37344 RepID=UPI0006267C6A|nr:coiled-coil-helix-coiled-coil-helix domain-containing protein 7 [Athalia rosae]
MATPKEVRELNKEKQQRRSMKHVSNLNSEINNPCLKEHNLSQKCLSDNNYDGNQCQLYFLNYQNCTGFWHKVSLDRRKQGLEPYLPLPEDRAAIKESYLKADKVK